MPTIRRAGVDDIEKVIELRLAFLRDVRGEDLPPDWVDTTRRYIEEKLPTEEFQVWFAEESGEIIGTSGMILYYKFATFELRAYVLNMYTLPAWRRKGIATMLLQHMIEHVKTTPARKLVLHATEMGRPVYEKLGFVAPNTEMMLDIEA
jgi:GNAT superfamily N-acetyltransferase